MDQIIGFFKRKPRYDEESIQQTANENRTVSLLKSLEERILDLGERYIPSFNNSLTRMHSDIQTLAQERAVIVPDDDVMRNIEQTVGSINIKMKQSKKQSKKQTHQIDSVSDRIDMVIERMDRMSERWDRMSERWDRMDDLLINLSDRVIPIHSRLDRLDHQTFRILTELEILRLQTVNRNHDRTQSHYTDCFDCDVLREEAAGWHKIATDRADFVRKIGEENDQLIQDRDRLEVEIIQMRNNLHNPGLRTPKQNCQNNDDETHRTDPDE